MKQVRKGVIHTQLWDTVPEGAAAHSLVAGRGWESALRTPPTTIPLAGPSRVDQDQERLVQVALLRDICGKRSQTVVFPRKWRTDTAVALAHQMYESRDFGAMPILADALQEAGCEDADILAHCRDAEQVHVRGCWVVDLVLGKS